VNRNPRPRAGLASALLAVGCSPNEPLNTSFRDAVTQFGIGRSGTQKGTEWTSLLSQLSGRMSSSEHSFDAGEGEVRQWLAFCRSFLAYRARLTEARFVVAAALTSFAEKNANGKLVNSLAFWHELDLMLKDFEALPEWTAHVSPTLKDGSRAASSQEKAGTATWLSIFSERSTGLASLHRLLLQDQSLGIPMLMVFLIGLLLGTTLPRMISSGMGKMEL
jgi:hypothetical protein